MKKKTTVFDEVRWERAKQDEKWGEQNHDPFAYLAILGEEVGEANKAAVDAATWKINCTVKFGGLGDYRKELIQVAAVAIAMIECLDRDKWDNAKDLK